ncbi:putative RNA methyltransferase [Paraglaciecola aestuariivivens]
MSNWICPACFLPLSLEQKLLACAQGHRFDMAKEGYVNLLLAQHKNSKQPGDNKQMVNGRRAFLEQGYYQPLADGLAGIFADYLAKQQASSGKHFFDAGCGEGYYINDIRQSIDNQHVHYSGVDISKFAVQKAAKKYPEAHFAVASTYQIPLPDGQQDAVLQIFAPSSETEILRILKAQGIWITVNPAANHLQQLKQCLYDNPTEHKSATKQPEGFELILQQQLSFDFVLTEPQQRENLLMMTPYFWTATEAKKHRLMAELQEVTADFDIAVFAKR